MKTLKIIAAALALAVITIPSHAQEGGWPLKTQSIALPSVIPVANDPTNFATPILIDLGKTCVVTPSFTVSSSVNRTNVTFTGCWSDDGVNMDTNNPVLLVAAAGVATPLTTCTNSLTGNGRRYFYLISESGAGGGIITNNSASYDATASSY